MIEWPTILYGAAVSAILSGIVVAIAARQTRLGAALVAAIGAFAGPLAWNAVLKTTAAREFFVDAPITALPASWQDTGSGVFALAATALLLGLGPLGAQPARRTVSLALLTGVVAFLVDVYLY